MKKSLFYTVLFWVISGTITAQESFNSNFKESIRFTKMADELNNLDSVIIYRDEALNWGQKAKNDSLIRHAYYNLGVAQFRQGGNESLAIKNVQLSLNYAIKNADQNLAYNCLNLLGALQSISGNNDSSIYYFDLTLKKSIELNDTLKMADTYNNLGKAYLGNSSDPETNKLGKSFLLKSIELHVANNSSADQIFWVYRNLVEASTNHEEKTKYLEKALHIAQENDLKGELADLYMVMGRLAQNDEDFPSADNYFRESLNGTLKLGMDLHTQANLLFLIDVNTKMEQYEDALGFVTQFDSLFNYKTMVFDNRTYYLEVVSAVYAKTKKAQEAYNLAMEYVVLQDSIAKEKLNEQFAKYNQEFELEEKNSTIAQNELALAQKEAERNQLVFGGVVLLLITLGGFQWFLYRQKKKKQEVEQNLQKEQEMNHLRTHFLENIAHEIRTPITLINGYLTLALENSTDNKSVTKNIQNAIVNSDKVLSNANEILELLKLDNGKIPLRTSEIQIDHFLKRVFFSFESLAEIKRIKLNYQSNVPRNIVMQSDESRLEKILNNFVANAIKFSPSNTEIIFDVSLTDGQLKVKVTDFGPGVKPEEQKQIFKRFYQASNTKNVGGVGIGLALATELAESLNGEVYVDSQENKGATFVLDIPVKTSVSTKTLTEEIEVSETKLEVRINPESKPRILIVEDNPEMNEYLSKILCEHFECDVAFDGAEGLQKVQTKKYSLIISDVMMPQMDGFELKQSINSLVNYKNVPFVFITAKAQLDDKITGYNLGIDDYVTKPFVKEELLVRIKTLMTNKKEREHWVKDNLEFVENDANAEEKLLEKIKQTIHLNLANENFKVTDLAREVGFSQRQLTRLLKKSVGLSPVRFILELRLQKAYLCLANKKFATLSELRHHVGISSGAYFNKKFLERFGVKPGEV